MLSAIILSGGRSSRMGTDKAGLIFKGESFLENQKRKLAALGIEDIVISGYGEGMIPDETPDCGPIGGLCTCLKHIENDAAVVLPIDTMLVTDALLRSLMTAFESADADIMLLRHGEKIEPLIGIYSKSAAEAMQGLIDQGRYSLRGILPCCRHGFFDYAGSEDVLMNCNRPEEYQALIKQQK